MNVKVNGSVVAETSKSEFVLEITAKKSAEWLKEAYEDLGFADVEIVGWWESL